MQLACDDLSKDEPFSSSANRWQAQEARSLALRICQKFFRLFARSLAAERAYWLGRRSSSVAKDDLEEDNGNK